MKLRFIELVFVCLLGVSCSSNHPSYNNPNLLNVTVHFTVNISLPQFSPLQFVMNPVYVGGYGNGGVILMKVGTDAYVAFDAADPNHLVENCSTLKINGIQGVCQCSDHNTYNLATGTVIESKSGGKSFEYTMKPYRVTDNGNGTLTISN